MRHFNLSPTTGIKSKADPISQQEDLNMRTGYRIISAGATLLAMLLLAPAHGASLNESIKIAAGEQSHGASTVNGSVSIGDAAVVTGDLSTVNGAIRIGSDARVGNAETVNGSLQISDRVQSNDLSSVNGSINIGSYVIVDGEVSAVNGKISLGSGTSIARDVGNVNGNLSLRGAEVGGDLSTVNGDVSLEGQSVVRGDLTVEKPTGQGNSKSRKPRVVIGPGSLVAGTIVNTQPVELYIRESATVGGVGGILTMDDAVIFSGKRP
jgi:hypothetical protein